VISHLTRRVRPDSFATVLKSMSICVYLRFISLSRITKAEALNSKRGRRKHGGFKSEALGKRREESDPSY
jgi:hypothetical protein